MLQEQKKDHEETAMMVLSATQTTAFMEDGAHMGITHDTGAQLQNKGIIVVADLIDFDKSPIEHIAADVCRSVGRIADPNPISVPRVTVPAPPFVFGAKS